MWISINWERLSEALNSTNLKRVDTFCRGKKIAIGCYGYLRHNSQFQKYFLICFYKFVCFHQPVAQPAAALVASCPGSTRGGRAQCLTDGSGRASEGRFGVLLGDFRCWGPMNQLQRDFQRFLADQRFPRGSVSVVSLWVSLCVLEMVEILLVRLFGLLPIATRAAALAKSPNRSQWTQYQKQIRNCF